MLRPRDFAFLAGTVLASLLPVSAVEAQCRLALVLALDVSSSVDAREDDLQRRGLAAALSAPDVQAAILSDRDYPVVLYVFEWSGRYQQSALLDWRYLRSSEDITDAAAAIAESSRQHSNFPTALGYALGHAVTLIREGPQCERRTIDVSGDGRNNAGFGPQTAYRHFPFDGVTVNGLAIGGTQEGLPLYYEANVIRGPGAFVEKALNFEDFQTAMERKLIRETATPELGQLNESPPPILR